MVKTWIQDAFFIAVMAVLVFVGVATCGLI